MLFNSYQFIFIFLPCVFLGFFYISRFSHHLSALWLALASLLFYGVWNPQFVLLLLSSIGFNYSMGFAIGHAKSASKRLLIIAITINLLLLIYYKYTNFFISVASETIGVKFELLNIILPLGISFFTFTQIAFLVDVYKGIAREYNFVHYLLFVTYFPHLIAGPVLHHKQMMPQFQRASTYKLNFENINIGIMIFSIGLFKKVLFADQFALFATPFFNSVTEASQPNLTDAWMGAILYTLQLYFDFSGYSDMAIGISKMFNVDLPFNFNSPYKANNIIDFWRRWHITLSSFLRDYLYIPLGGNRKGVFRRYINLIVTMLLGGMWHGASWNFILWGALHGIYLAINHLWISLTGKLAINTQISDILGKIITFLAVVVAWVIFRAKDIGSGLRILEGMFGFNDNTLPSFFEIAKNIIAYLFPHYHLVFTKVPPGQTMGLFLGLVIVFLLPNSQELVGLYSETNKNLLKKYFILNQSFVSAFYIGFLFFISVLMIMSGSESEFLYFQF